MKLPLRSRREDVGMNMTPMIDVVFLLIIFFLVSSHLARQEAQLQLDLPAAESGESNTESTRPRVVVNIRPTGEISLAGSVVQPSELTRRLQVELEKNSGDLELRIRSDRHVEYQRIEPILLACARAGVWNLTFSVIRKEDR